MKTVSRRAFSLGALSLGLGTTLAACGSESEQAAPTVTREDVAGAPPTRTATTVEENVPTEAGSPAASPIGTPDGGEATPGGETPGTGGATEVSVEMKEMVFEPTELTIAANTDVTVTASNVGVLEHDFSVTDQDLTTGTVSSGNSAQVVINLPAGMYEFFCSIPGHKEAGMVGSLIVQ